MPMRHLARWFAAAAAALAVVVLPYAARAATTFTSTSITTDNFTANGNITLNDASADTILIGQNGASPDTVTIAGDVSLTDANWSVSAAGAASFGTLNGLTLVANVDGFQVGGGSTASRTFTLTGGNLTLTAAGATSLTLPSSGTLATLAGSETLSNKAIAAPRITSGIFDNNGNEIVLFPLTAAAVNEFSMSNAATTGNPVLQVTGGDTNIGVTLQTKGTGDFDFQTSTATTDVLRLRPAAGAARNPGVITSADLTATRTWTLPDSTGSIVLDAATQTLTNKTINTPRIGSSINDANGNELFLLSPIGAAVNEFTISNAIASTQPILSTSGTDIDISMRLQTKGSGTFILQNSVTNADQFEISPASGGGTSFAGTVTSADLTAGRTWTLPDAAGTIVLDTATQTLTNKTLTAPRVSGIKDTNGNDVLAFNATAVAVNGFQMFNAGTGVDPSLLVVGADANIDMRVQAKGTGTVMLLNSSTGADMFAFQPAAGASTFLGTVTSADLTGNQTWTLPNATGTLALTTDITGAAGWIDGGALVSLVTSTDNVAIGAGGGTTQRLMVDTGSTTVKGVVVKRVALQTAALQEWQNESASALAFIGADGSFTTTNALTANGLVALGDASTDRVNVAGELRLGTATADPSGTNGLMYYNGSTNKFRCFEAGAWKDCDTAAGVSVSGTPLSGQAAFFTGASTLTADGSFFWDNANKRLGIGTNVPPTTLTVVASSAVTANPVTSLQIDTMTTGTPTGGFGSSLLFRAEDTGGTADVAATLDAVFIDPTNTTEDSEVRFTTRNAGGALVNALTIGGTSGLTIPGTAMSDAPSLNGTVLRVNGQTFTDSATASSGTNTSFVFNAFHQPTLAAANATVSTTNAANVYIAGAPSAGTNMTIAMPMALWVGSGKTRFDGDLHANGHVVLGDSAADTVTANAASMALAGDFNVDSNTLMINGSLNRVGIGTNNPFAKFHVSADGAAINGAFDVSDTVVLSRQGNILGTSMIVAGTGSLFHPVIRGVRANGTLQAPTVVQSGDRVLSLQGQIFDGTDLEGTAEIRFSASGAVTTDVAPQQISFFTSPSNFAGSVERLRVSANGAVEVYTSLVVGNSGSPLSQHKSVLATLDLLQATSGACSVLQVDASGIGLSVAVGDMVTIVPAFDDNAWDAGQLTIFVELAGQLKVTFCNQGSTIDPPSGQYRISHWKY